MSVTKELCWRMIMAGVHQGSVIGPVLLLVSINSLAENLISDVRYCI